MEILFDENIGEGYFRDYQDRFLEKLKQLGDNDPQVNHVVLKWGSGTLDEIWVPQLEARKVIVFSYDRGRRCGGEKLPALCYRHEIPLVLFCGKKLQTISSAQRYEIALEYLEEIYKGARKGRLLEFYLRVSEDNRIVYGHGKRIP